MKVQKYCTNVLLHASRVTIFCCPKHIPLHMAKGLREHSWIQHFLGGKRLPARKATSPQTVSRLSRENMGASTSHNSTGLHGLLQGWLYLTSPPFVSRLSRENMGASTSHNSTGLHGLLQGGLYLTSPPFVSRLSRENVGASTSHNPMGLHGLLQG
jgi:hypothetical protein